MDTNYENKYKKRLKFNKDALIQELVDETRFFEMPLILAESLKGLGGFTDIFGSIYLKKEFVQN
jgi:hypothetical protein